MAGGQGTARGGCAGNLIHFPLFHQNVILTSQQAKTRSHEERALETISLAGFDIGSIGTSMGRLQRFRAGGVISARATRPMGHSWRAVFAGCGWGQAEARRLSLSGLEASWLPEPAKAALRTEFNAALDALEASLDPTDRAIDLSLTR